MDWGTYMFYESMKGVKLKDIKVNDKFLYLEEVCIVTRVDRHVYPICLNIGVRTTRDKVTKLGK